MNTPPVDSTRLLELFDACIDLAPAARAARLSALRGEHAALADELARMLAADDASGVLDRGMAAMAATVAGDLDPNSRAADGARGRRVGPFVLERLLGRGGMGEVWLAAREEAGFRQDVALKLLKRGMDSEDLLRRFVQERRILAGLSHPGIARFIDGGVGDDGAPWYAMEYVEGVPLTEHARQRGLDVRARVDLVASVAEAVAYAQNRLVVHRDLKPSNILVDPQGRVRLLDFGIAKLLDEAPGADATATGVRAMSPAYAAPEQILDQPISAATDVYALGVVLYELLTGGLPHERASATLETLAERVRHEAPDRPSARLRRSDATTTTTLGADANTAQRFARAVAGELDTIVLTALRREPERRYGSAAAFADDLRRWLDGRPVAAQADTASYRMRKFVARHRLAVGSASAVLLALIAGFGTALWQAGVAREQARRAAAEAQRAEREAALGVELAERTERVKEFMMQTFVQADPLRRGSAPPATVAEAFDAALARAETLSDDPKLQVDILDDFGEIRAGQGRIDEAIVLFDRAVALAQSTWGDAHPVLAEALLNRGIVESYRGRHGDGVPYLEKSVAILAGHVDQRPLEYAHALSTLAVMQDSLNLRQEAMANNDRALELFRRHADPGERLLAVALYNNGTMKFNYGDAEAAEPLLREALSIVESIDGRESPSLAPMLAMLYEILYREGDLAGARGVADRRLALVRAAFPAAHPWTSTALNDAGLIHYQLGDREVGLAMLQESAAMMQVLGSEVLMVPLRHLAVFLQRDGRIAEARDAIERAHAFCVERGIPHVRCMVVRATRAHLLALAGDPGAVPEAEAARAALEGAGADDETHYVIALEALATAQRATGRVREAQDALDEAVSLAIRIYGEVHPEVDRVRAVRAAIASAP